MTSMAVPFYYTMPLNKFSTATIADANQMPRRVTFSSNFLPFLADQDAAIYMDLKRSGQVMQYNVHASGVMALRVYVHQTFSFFHFFFIFPIFPPRLGIQSRPDRISGLDHAVLHPGGK